MNDTQMYRSMITVLGATILGFVVFLVFNWLPQRGRRAEVGPDKVQELIFIYGGNCYHIHHYILFLPLIAFMWIHRLGDTFLYVASGFLLGASLEDLMWDDWYKVKNNCHLDVVKKLPSNI